jgi:HAMP domain-containing protein
MAAILLISIVLTFVIVNASLAPIKELTERASDLADGKQLEEDIQVTRKDEIGRLQATLDRLRLSMLIALKRKK